jgi:hypothetical protein
MLQFKTGDEIQVVDSSFGYNSFEELAKERGLVDFIKGAQVLNGLFGTVNSVPAGGGEGHRRVFGIRVCGQDYLVGEDGLKLVEKKPTAGIEVGTRLVLDPGFDHNLKNFTEGKVYVCGRVVEHGCLTKIYCISDTGMEDFGYSYYFLIAAKDPSAEKKMVVGSDFTLVGNNDEIFSCIRVEKSVVCSGSRIFYLDTDGLETWAWERYTSLVEEEDPPKPEVDEGADLIGKVVTLDTESCPFKFISYCSLTKRMNMESVSDPNRAYHHFIPFVRKRLEVGAWKLVEEDPEPIEDEGSDLIGQVFNNLVGISYRFNAYNPETKKLRCLNITNSSFPLYPTVKRVREHIKKEEWEMQTSEPPKDNLIGMYITTGDSDRAKICKHYNDAYYTVATEEGIKTDWGRDLVSDYIKMKLWTVVAHPISKINIGETFLVDETLEHFPDNCTKGRIYTCTNRTPGVFYAEKILFLNDKLEEVCLYDTCIVKALPPHNDITVGSFFVINGDGDKNILCTKVSKINDENIKIFYMNDSGVEDWIWSNFAKKASLVCQKPKEDTGKDLIGTIYKMKALNEFYKIVRVTDNKKQVVIESYPRQGSVIKQLSIVFARKQIAGGKWEIQGQVEDPSEEEGEDLIGEVFTRPDNITYEIKEYNPRTKKLKCVDIINSKSCYYVEVPNARKYLSTGTWVLLPEAEEEVELKAYTSQFPEPNQTVTKFFEFHDKERPEAWQKYNPQTEECSTSEVTGDDYNKYLKQQPTEEINMVYLKDKKEKESKMKNTTTINIDVSNKAFDKKEITTLYGRDLNDMNEAHLFDVLRRIKADQDILEELETGDMSKRISSKVKALKTARGKVIDLIDLIED